MRILKNSEKEKNKSMRFTDVYLKINRAFEQFEKWLAIALISFIVIIVFAGTIARYVFNEPLFGADRLATYLMVWLGFIGFQIATSKLRHIEVEFLKARVSAQTKYKMNMATSFLAAIFLVIFAIIGFKYVGRSIELADVDLVLSIPLWIIILIIPISFSIAAVRFFCTIFLWLDVLKGIRKEEEILKKQIL